MTLGAWPECLFGKEGLCPQDHCGTHPQPSNCVLANEVLHPRASVGGSHQQFPTGRRAERGLVGVVFAGRGVWAGMGDHLFSAVLGLKAFQGAEGCVGLWGEGGWPHPGDPLAVLRVRTLSCTFSWVQSQVPLGGGGRKCRMLRTEVCVCEKGGWGVFSFNLYWHQERVLVHPCGWRGHPSPHPRQRWGTRLQSLGPDHGHCAHRWPNMAGSAGEGPSGTRIAPRGFVRGAEWPCRWEGLLGMGGERPPCPFPPVGQGLPLGLRPVPRRGQQSPCVWVLWAGQAGSPAEAAEWLQCV